MRRLGNSSLNDQMPDGKKFVWGDVLKIHKIADYTIVEYAKDNSNTHGADMDRVHAEHGRTEFHAYYGNRDTSRGYLSIEAALVGTIAYVKHHVNSKLDDYFMTVIEADMASTDYNYGLDRQLTTSTVENRHVAILA